MRLNVQLTKSGRYDWPVPAAMGVTQALKVCWKHTQKAEGLWALASRAVGGSRAVGARGVDSPVEHIIKAADERSGLNTGRPPHSNLIPGNPSGGLSHSVDTRMGGRVNNRGGAVARPLH